MLVESRIDGAKYALKILSKKHLRNSDKKQLRAERDILHSMSQKSPHPFTTGLKFAFQSENNLYLGMEYFPGGNMKQLIKSMGRLPEVTRSLDLL
jgi:serine/threonine protein kinase